MRWPAWKMYAPIFIAAEGAYVAGGGVPRPELALARWFSRELRSARMGWLQPGRW